MDEDTIVAVFDTPAHAEAAISDLRMAQVPESAITSHAGRTTGATTMAHTEATPVPEDFWASLFGGEPDHSISVYKRSMEAGATVVAVKVPHEHVARVTGLLETHHPVDLDERAAQYGLPSVPHPDTTAMPLTQTAQQPASQLAAGVAQAGADMLQLSEERLAVGKRVVNRGGTRIRRFVVETPVEQQVTLHDETVTLERHPVTDGRIVDAASAFTDRTIEMTESHEEAVIAKTVHVVEEIALRKQATDHVETVRDTLRREDVAIEQIPADATISTTSSTATATAVPKV